MQLEDYFDFLAPDDIRIKGHRLGIESVLYEFIYRGQSAEEIARRFPTLTLEQVHAVLLYFLRNKPTMDQYMADWIESSHRAREAQQQTGSALRERVRKRKSEQQALQPVRP